MPRDRFKYYDFLLHCLLTILVFVFNILSKLHNFGVKSVGTKEDSCEKNAPQVSYTMD